MQKLIRIPVVRTGVKAVIAHIEGMKLNRRDFLKKSMAVSIAAGAAWRVSGAEGKTFRTAIIGTGWWGMNILGEAMTSRRCPVVAMCDVDQRLLDPAWEKVNTLTGLEPKRYRDY